MGTSAQLLEHGSGPFGFFKCRWFLNRLSNHDVFMEMLLEDVSCQVNLLVIKLDCSVN
jgi:hypothetical protein